jgi:hypothetical protein
MERVSDVRLDRAKANVSPDTTIATSDSPRAMVLVKAVSSTLTALSHGELPAWARAGPARTRITTIATKHGRNQEARRILRRGRFISVFSLFLKLWK